MHLSTSYGVHMRNTPGPGRGSWATLVQSRREAVGMTKVDLARRLDVDRATVHRWEQGTYSPDDPGLVQRVADLFGIGLDEALAAAGLRPDDAPRTEPLRPALDPALIEAQAMLDDPDVSPAVKAQVHLMLNAMVEMARQQPKIPKRRRAG